MKLLRPIDYTWRVTHNTVLGFIQDQGFRLAAALAFYAILSLGPLFVILLMLIGRIWGAEEAQRQVILEVRHFVSGPAAEAMVGLIEQAQAPSQKGMALAVSLGVLMFSGMAVFVQLQDSMNCIWNVPRDRPRVWLVMVRSRVVALFMLAVLAVLAVVLVVVTSMLEIVINTFRTIHPQLVETAPILNWGVSLFVFIALFFVVFKWIPEADIPWRDAFIGATATGLLFAVGRDIISAILTQTKPVSAYGAAGSIIVILLWVYYSSLILFIGAEFTQALARVRGAATTPERDLTEDKTNRPSIHDDERKPMVEEYAPPVVLEGEELSADPERAAQPQPVNNLA